MEHSDSSSIESFLENLAQGEISISEDGNTTRIFKLISEKIKNLPRTQSAVTKLNREYPQLLKIIEKRFEVNNIEGLIYVFATVSLQIDTTEEFQKKYENYLREWKRDDSSRYFSKKNMSIFYLEMFQWDANIQKKSEQTSVGYVNTLFDMQSKGVNYLDDEIWNSAIYELAKTNLRTLKVQDIDAERKQEFLLRTAIEKKMSSLVQSPDEQSRYLIRILKPIIAGKYNFNFKGLDSYFDSILNHSNPNDVMDQIQILSEYHVSRTNWELNIPPTEFMRRTLSLVDNCTADVQLCDGAKAIVIGLRVNYYLVTSQFEKVMEVTQEYAKLTSLIEPPQLGWTINQSLSLVIELRVLTAQGKFGSAELLVSKIRNLIGQRDQFVGLSDAAYYSFVASAQRWCLEFELAIGQFSKVKSTTELILNAIDEHIKDGGPASVDILLNAKTIMLQLLDQAKIGLGEVSQKKFTELFPWKDPRDTEHNYGISYLMKQSWSAFWAKDFQRATNWISLSIRHWEDGTRWGLFTPSKHMDHVLGESMALVEAHLGLTEINWELVDLFHKKTNLDSEMLLYLDAYRHQGIDELELHLLNWMRYERINEIRYAAFYAKRYVNLLQTIRQNLKDNNSPALSSFTEPYKTQLQKMSSTLFESGDFVGAISVLSIIKENELQDFSTSIERTSLSTTFLSYSEQEKIFFSIVSSLVAEHKFLSSQFFNIRLLDPNADDRLLRQALERTNEEIGSALINLRTKLLVNNNDQLQKELILNREYPVLQSSVTPSGVIFYLSENGTSTRFVASVNRAELRELIYQFYDVIVKQTNDWHPLAEKLNQLLFRQVEEYLIANSIRKLYFVSDDALAFLPIDLILNISNDEIEVVNLVNLTNTKPPSREVSIPRLDAFGATRGNRTHKPLPAAKTEIDFLSSFNFSNKASTLIQSGYLDDKFTLNALQHSLSNRTQIVHVASHFNANGSSDKDVGLLMGNGEFVSIAKLMQDDRTYAGVELLTLSACETALSQSNMAVTARSFDGLASLFARKGVSQVLAAMWKISDSSTAAFMKVFYIYRQAEGLTSSEAQAATKKLFKRIDPVQQQYLAFKYPQVFTKDFIRSLENYKHPYYWAGFVLFSADK
jgi:CHAT domain-containing protein